MVMGSWRRSLSQLRYPAPSAIATHSHLGGAHGCAAGRKEERLSEKRSKTFYAAVAGYKATARKSALVRFFKKELLALTRISRISADSLVQEGRIWHKPTFPRWPAHPTV